MKRNRNRLKNVNYKLCFKGCIFLALTITSIQGLADPHNSSASSKQTGTYQLDRLFYPSQHDLLQERSGQVFIYDGLFHDQVELAMELEFERIEHMMFVRTKSEQPSGDIIEDNDCD